MLILYKSNNLSLFKFFATINTSFRKFRCYSSIASNVTHSSHQFNASESKLFKKTLQMGIGQHVQRFMHSNRPEQISNVHKVKSKPFYTDDSNPDEVSIYQGKYTNQILRVKMFSLTTSAMGLVAQPILWHKGLEVGGAGLSVLMCSVAGIFTFVTPLLLHFVTKKYVIDIKYNEKTDEYTCVTISFFLFRNETKFNVKEIHLPEVETMFTSMKIGPKKIPVFVDAASFNDTHHYARFMGYDKPMNIRLDVNEINSTANSDVSSTKMKSTQTPDKP
ncbi:transmembrane protein 70 homolog, mitochondrial [Sitodiplosis mosellana]|uniref:transmembrane protein 70 homolog, mitochondrial n=1 Tax=Sitodiplosis mosellana TaxID=263140 RepID=UPI002443DC25|nr:transmembrane protein 70 homolog, mitochondrial [Sitodiplosis mosellana]